MAATARVGFLCAAVTAAAVLAGALAARFGGPGWAVPVLACLGLGAICGVLAPRLFPSAPRDTPEAQHTAARLAELEARTGTLRHDLRGMLAPAMLVADRLSENADPKVAKAGETIVRAVNRVSDRLAQTKPPQQADAATPPAPR